MRAFLAVEISEEIRENVAALQSDLRGVRARVKWVRPANMHLTLVFLGDVAEEVIALMAEEADRVAADSGPFTCEVAGIGFFGRPRAPRIVWAGVGDGAGQLSEIQARLASTARQLGVEVEDRPFTPHLTLARVRSPAHAKELVTGIEARREEKFGRFEAERIALIGSRLEADGPVYTVLHESRLTGGISPG